MEPARGPKLGRRHAIRVSQAELVQSGLLPSGSPLPLLVQPTDTGLSLAAWLQANRSLIEQQLRRHGGLLLRGFEVGGAGGFERCLHAAAPGGPLPYQDGSSPRSQVQGHIYTSTDYPAEAPIFLHSELSYAGCWPMKVLFYCVRPADRGGETPIADTRRVWARIDPAVREAFCTKGVMYIRNFGDGLGLSWQQAFRTAEPTQVEAYCRRQGITCEWQGAGRLRTRQVRQAAAVHPHTGEVVWFNHAAFFHPSTLTPAVRDALLAQLAPEELPYYTCFGDGSAIAAEVIEQVRAAYRLETSVFAWQAQDVLLLDNMLTAHGRNPYTGARQVLVGMAEPHGLPKAEQ
ncbi:MAG: TauD/TfdA family dioxygenase [Aphanocapsa lilacina HA4352-LM1]|jgi:alpha-ketoglutarate-dependent taurine dioxygenase|nr:TauD/TfdA family dioxygenase [Aphanocapsa lilacina HA4352-LM1]